MADFKTSVICSSKVIASEFKKRGEIMQKFCPNCGKPVKSTDKVCGNCGTPLAKHQNQPSVNKETVSQPSRRSQHLQKKKHSAYKWVIGVGVVAVLAGGGYLVYKNTSNANNSASIERKQSTSSSKKSNHAQDKSSSTTDSSDNSSDDQDISTEENDNQEDTNSSNDQESVSDDNQESTSSSTDREDTNSSSHEEKNDGKETVADIGPKTLASSVLLLGGKKSEVWKSFATQDNLEINVNQDTSDNDNYSEPGTGVAYMFTSDGKNGGELLEYRLSSDGSTVYCYEQPFKDSATRHVTPFATLSAKEIQQVKDSAKVKNLVDKMEVKS